MLQTVPMAIIHTQKTFIVTLISRVLLPHFSCHVHCLTLCYWIKQWTLFLNRQPRHFLHLSERCDRSETCKLLIMWSFPLFALSCIIWERGEGTKTSAPAPLSTCFSCMSEVISYVIVVLLRLRVCGCRAETQDRSQGFRFGPVNGSRSLVITETFPSTLPRL